MPHDVFEIDKYSSIHPCDNLVYKMLAAPFKENIVLLLHVPEELLYQLRLVTRSHP